METKLLKPIVRMGNSACVMLPKAWINGKARVELIQEPLNITKDVFEILKPYLKDVLGIYLVGSYARGEETQESDIDILVITENINKKINKGKYDTVIPYKYKNIPKSDNEKFIKSLGVIGS